MELRETISQRMRDLNLKQVEVAERVGIKVQNLNAFLKGFRTLPYGSLEKVCALLGLTLTPNEIENNA